MLALFHSPSPSMDLIQTRGSQKRLVSPLHTTVLALNFTARITQLFLSPSLRVNICLPKSKGALGCSCPRKIHISLPRIRHLTPPLVAFEIHHKTTGLTGWLDLSLPLLYAFPSILNGTVFAYLEAIRGDVVETTCTRNSDAQQVMHNLL